MRKPCPHANPECKYFNKPTPPELANVQEHGCYADRSHEYYPEPVLRALGSWALAFYKAHWQQECRDQHDERHKSNRWHLPTAKEVEDWYNGNTQ